MSDLISSAEFRRDVLGCRGIKTFMLEDTGKESQEGFTIYRRADTGEEWPWLNPAPKSMPVGGMYWCSWLDEWGFKRKMEMAERDPEIKKQPHRYHPDANGRCLAVITPGGYWIIDSRASNCTMPNDNDHRCWVRHGEAPNITVDKNGLTCAAGAGSIQCGSWHGYLRDGELVT